MTEQAAARSYISYPLRIPAIRWLGSNSNWLNTVFTAIMAIAAAMTFGLQFFGAPKDSGTIGVQINSSGTGSQIAGPIVFNYRPLDFQYLKERASKGSELFRLQDRHPQLLSNRGEVQVKDLINNDSVPATLDKKTANETNTIGYSAGGISTHLGKNPSNSGPAPALPSARPNTASEEKGSDYRYEFRSRSIPSLAPRSEADLFTADEDDETLKRTYRPIALTSSYD